jgi:hypothetical protein
MDFSAALDRIKWGQPMSRAAWGNSSVYVFRLNPPDLDTLCMRLASGSIVLWTASADDIMASDWLDVLRIN